MDIVEIGDNEIIVDIQAKKEGEESQEEKNSYMQPSPVQPPPLESNFSSGAAVVQQPTVQPEKSGGVAFLLASERFLVDYLPWMLVSLLNVLTFGCYIYDAFMFILWLLVVVFVNELNIVKKVFHSEPNMLTDNLHQVIIITLFLGNFINSQQAL